MESVDIASVTGLGDYAFADCVKLNSFTYTTVNTSLLFIGKSAFANCAELTSFVMEANVSRIDAGAFVGCSALTSVEFKDPEGWSYRVENGEGVTKVSVDKELLQDAAVAAEMLTGTNGSNGWEKYVAPQT
ncbi:MAG: leucine-rich repeat domain-containing protein [Corallococcus sp.]|nr:leucine-rich repeat domain-containing protein [Corallococcus sp.]